MTARVNGVDTGTVLDDSDRHLHFAANVLGGEPGSHPGRPAAISAQLVARLAGIGPAGPTGTFQEDDGELGW